MTQASNVEQRLAQLEADVAALGRDHRPAVPAPHGQRLWALETLRRAEPEPSVVYAGIAELSDGRRAEWQMGRPTVALLDADWDAGLPALSALGHPVRLRLLRHVLRDDARTAAELTALEGIGTTGQTYHHLRQLIAGGWLRNGIRGTHEVPVERVVPLLAILAAAGV